MLEISDNIHGEGSDAMEKENESNNANIVKREKKDIVFDNDEILKREKKDICRRRIFIVLGFVVVLRLVTACLIVRG